MTPFPDLGFWGVKYLLRFFFWGGGGGYFIIPIYLDLVVNI